jgi:hypothetical protein
VIGFPVSRSINDGEPDFDADFSPAPELALPSVDVAGSFDELPHPIGNDIKAATVANNISLRIMFGAPFIGFRRKGSFEFHVSSFTFRVSSFWKSKCSARCFDFEFRPKTKYHELWIFVGTLSACLSS